MNKKKHIKTPGNGYIKKTEDVVRKKYILEVNLSANFSVLISTYDLNVAKENTSRVVKQPRLVNRILKSLEHSNIKISC